MMLKHDLMGNTKARFAYSVVFIDCCHFIIAHCHLITALMPLNILSSLCTHLRDIVYITMLV